MDPDVLKKAKRIAHVRKTSVSGLLEDLVRHASVRDSKAGSSFTDQWAGKFRVRQPAKRDPRLQALKTRYGLGD